MKGEEEEEEHHDARFGFLKDVPSFKYDDLIDPKNRPCNDLVKHLIQSPIKALNRLHCHLEHLQRCLDRNRLLDDEPCSSITQHHHEEQDTATEHLVFLKKVEEAATAAPPSLDLLPPTHKKTKKKQHQTAIGLLPSTISPQPSSLIPLSASAPSSAQWKDSNDNRSDSCPSRSSSSSRNQAAPLVGNEETEQGKNNDYRVLLLRRYCFYANDGLLLKKAMNEIRVNHLVASTSSSSGSTAATASSSSSLDEGHQEDVLIKGRGQHNILPLLGYVRQEVLPAGRRSLLHPPPSVVVGLLTPFASAGSLRHRILCDARIGEKEVMRWVEEILAALAHCHALGIVHRNVCLDTVQLMPGGKDPQSNLPIYHAKLGEFASALEIGKEQAEQGIIDERDLKAHERFMMEVVQDWPRQTLAPEIKSLLPDASLPSPSSSSSSTELPLQQDYPYYKEAANFACLSALDVWSVGTIGYQMMLKKVDRNLPLTLAVASYEDLRASLPRRFDAAFFHNDKEGLLTQALAKDPRERTQARPLLDCLLKHDLHHHQHQSHHSAKVAKSPKSSSTKNSSMNPTTTTTKTRPPPQASSLPIIPAVQPSTPPALPIDPHNQKVDDNNKATTAAAAPSMMSDEEKELTAMGILQNVDEAVVAPQKDRTKADQIFINIEQGRALATIRAKAYLKQLWFEHLTGRQQRQVVRRRQAYKVARAKLHHRRELIHVAAFRHWQLHQLIEWIVAAVIKDEKKNLIRHPLQPRRRRTRADARRRSSSTAHRKSSAFSAGHAGAAGNGEENKVHRRSSTSSHCKSSVFSDHAGGGGKVNLPAEMRYSARLGPILQAVGGFTGIDIDESMYEAKERAKGALELMRSEAERDKEERERKGIIARSDYHDKVNVAKNFIAYTAMEVARVALFNPIFRRLFPLLVVPREIDLAAAEGGGGEEASACQEEGGQKKRQRRKSSIAQELEDMSRECSNRRRSSSLLRQVDGTGAAVEIVGREVTEEEEKALAAQCLDLEKDKQAIGECIVRAFDALQASRRQGEEEAACLITALFRGLCIRQKLRRIWEHAERQAKEALNREEREREQALRESFESMAYLELHPFAIGSSNACLKLSTPVWMLLRKISNVLSLAFDARIEHPRIIIDILPAPLEVPTSSSTSSNSSKSKQEITMEGQKDQEDHHHIKVFELHSLLPNTCYTLSTNMTAAATEALYKIAERLKLDKENAEAHMQLLYIIKALTTWSKTTSITFTTLPSKTRGPPSSPPSHLTARLLRISTILPSHHQSFASGSHAEQQPEVVMRRISKPSSTRKGRTMMSLQTKKNHLTTDLISSSLPREEKDSPFAFYSPTPLIAIAVSWSSPLALTIGEGDNNNPSSTITTSCPALGLPTYLPGGSESSPSLLYIVQRLFRWGGCSDYCPEWVTIYKGHHNACLDLIEPRHVQDFFQACMAYLPTSFQQQQQQKNMTAATLSILYRVRRGDEVHGWSPFSSICRSEVPCGRVFVFDDDDDEEEEEGESGRGGMNNDKEQGKQEMEDLYAPSLFGLTATDLNGPDYLERSMRLPTISRRYHGPIAKQKPVLSGQGSVWHSVLSIDAKALAQRKERLMKYRATLRDKGDK